MRKSVLCLSVVFGVLFFSSSAYSQIMIEQGKIFIKANPGETIVDTLLIHNTATDKSINLRAYWEDFVYTDPFDGTKEFTAAGTSGYSASQWTNFSPQQFTMAPQSSKTISYTMQVPEDAKGGYYGVLFFEEGNESSPGQVGVSVVTRIGTLFFVEITNSTRKAKIANLKFENGHFVGDFTNLGDVMLIPESTYYILDKEGLVAERGEINKIYVAPQKTAVVKISALGKLPAGDFTGIFTFDFGDGQNLTHEFDFQKADDGKVEIIKQNEF